MLEYDRIDVSEGIYVNETNESRRYIICNYPYFLKVNFRFQPKACDGCHDLMQMATSFNDAATDTGNYYGISFWYISKDKAICLLKNFDLKEKSHHCKNTKTFFFLSFCLYI